MTSEIRGEMRNAYKIGKKMGVKVGICGQGPSDFPDFAQF
jgi:pyruvate,water dikinase